MKSIELELNLTVKEKGSFKIKSINTIKADSMIQLLSQFTLLVHQVMAELHEEELIELRSVNDDDIPF